MKKLLSNIFPAFLVMALTAMTLETGAEAGRKRVVLSDIPKPSNEPSKPLLIIAEDIEGEAMAPGRVRPGFQPGAKSLRFPAQSEGYQPTRQQQGRVQFDAD